MYSLALEVKGMADMAAGSCVLAGWLERVPALKSTYVERSGGVHLATVVGCRSVLDSRRLGAMDGGGKR